MSDEIQCLDFRPDWGRTGEPSRPAWAGMVNIDQFHWLTRRDVQDQLTRARDEIGTRHVRACAMYSGINKVYDRDPRSFHHPEVEGPRPNFRIPDYVFDSLLDRGLRPVFTTCFMPPALASSPDTVWNGVTHPTPPNDWKAWRDLVRAHLRHCIGRYGKREVREWYFECWNEPNLPNFFTGGREGFYELWRGTFEAVKSVDPDLRFGGPSTARAEWIPEFLDWTRAHDCPPDYVIAHVYNNDSESGALSPFDGPQEEKVSNSPHFCRGVFQGTRRLLDEAGFSGELHWNEWGRSWFPCDPVRESAQEAAFIVKSMAESSQLADSFAYWNLSDIYDQVGYGREAFHGNYGMLSLDGLRKLNYHAHELLCRLGPVRIPVEAAGGDDCAGAIATRDGHRLAVLVYRMDPEVNRPGPTRESRVAVALPAHARAVSLTRLTDRENNPVQRWRDMGSPDYPSRTDMAKLAASDALRADAEWDARPVDTGLEAVFRLDTPGVALLEAQLP